VRAERGDDIAEACGQLKTKEQQTKEEKKERAEGNVLLHS
jgi:hypothetical protein